MDERRMNLPERVILAICVPAIIVVVVLFVEVQTRSANGLGQIATFWIARESWWVWVLAIVAVTAFQLFLWRDRRHPPSDP